MCFPKKPRVYSASTYFLSFIDNFHVALLIEKIRNDLKYKDMEGFLTFLAVLLIIGVLVFPIIIIAMVSGMKGRIEVLNRRIMQLSQDLKNMAKPVEKTEVDDKPVEKIMSDRKSTRLNSSH